MLPALPTEAGSTSRGVATAVSANHGLSLLAGMKGAMVAKGRAALHSFSGLCKGGVALGNVYLEVGGFISKFSWEALLALVRCLRSWGGPFVIGGDWNCTPEVLKESWWLKLIDGEIVAPTQGTCRPAENVLDYYVVSRWLAPACTAEVLDRPEISPHRLVKLQVVQAQRPLERRARIPMFSPSSSPSVAEGRLRTKGGKVWRT